MIVECHLSDSPTGTSFRVTNPIRLSTDWPTTHRHALSGCEGSKKTLRPLCSVGHRNVYDRKRKLVRDLPCGDLRVYIDFESRRTRCVHYGMVRQEKLSWLAETPGYTKRFAYYVGKRCQESSIVDRSIMNATRVPQEGPVLLGFSSRAVAFFMHFSIVMWPASCV